MRVGIPACVGRVPARLSETPIQRADSQAAIRLFLAESDPRAACAPTASPAVQLFGLVLWSR